MCTESWSPLKNSFSASVICFSTSILSLQHSLPASSTTLVETTTRLTQYMTPSVQLKRQSVKGCHICLSAASALHLCDKKRMRRPAEDYARLIMIKPCLKAQISFISLFNRTFSFVLAKFFFLVSVVFVTGLVFL